MRFRHKGLQYLLDHDAEARQELLALVAPDAEALHTFVVVLMDHDGKPWNGRDALRIVKARSHEAAVQHAFPEPPSTTQVWAAHAWRVYGGAAEHYRLPVTVAKPKWAEHGDYVGGA